MIGIEEKIKELAFDSIVRLVEAGAKKAELGPLLQALKIVPRKYFFKDEGGTCWYSSDEHPQLEEGRWMPNHHTSTYWNHHFVAIVVNPESRKPAQIITIE